MQARDKLLPNEEKDSVSHWDHATSYQCATNLDPFVRFLGLVEVRLCLPPPAEHAFVLHTDTKVSRASKRGGQNRNNRNEHDKEPLTFPKAPVPSHTSPNQRCPCTRRVFRWLPLGEHLPSLVPSMSQPDGYGP